MDDFSVGNRWRGKREHYLCAKFDLFNHVLVPNHILLSEEETKGILKKFKIKPYQLPHIKVSDPVAISIGAKIGNIIKIIRVSPTAGEAIAYRYVVDG